MHKNNQIQVPIWQKAFLVIFGLFLTLVILEIGLRAGGFVILSIQEYKNRVSIRQKGNQRILCLGESTTLGQYPRFLEEVLNQRNTGIKFSVIDKGVVGATTGAILYNLESYFDTYHPDIVITMMGINDRGLFYELISDSKVTTFLKSFRTYKLTRLLWLHIVSRFYDAKFYKLSNYVTKLNLFLRKIKLQQVYVKEKVALPSKELLEFKKAIEINPRNDNAYVELGRLYLSQDKFLESEELFKKAIEINPRNDWAYFELGRLYREQDKFLEFEESFKKAIEINPRNDNAYVELGRLYRDQGKVSEIGESFKKAIEINPRNDNAYVELGRLYLSQDKFLESEELFKKAIEINPTNDRAYFELGWFYQVQGKFSESEESYKKAKEINSRNDRAYRALEALCAEMGNMERARKYGEEARDLRLNYNFSITNSNYHKFKTILDKRGIVWVCVQYPMRNLEPLKKIFQGNGKDIIFVDNEKIFRDAIKKSSYREYFVDMFAGDFGHCTDKGNRLLAENIANAILTEVFNK